MTSTHLLNLSTADFAESWICKWTGKEKTDQDTGPPAEWILSIFES